MSTIYGPPDAAPVMPWPGDPGMDGPGEPGGPDGTGPGGGGGGRRRWGHRHRLLAGLTSAVLVAGAAAGGTAWARSSAPPVLTPAQVAAKVSPALVDINTTLGYASATAAGTGIVLTPTGEILTNNHVIEGATRITATDVGNGRSYPAKVVGYDSRDDIAVLRLQGASGLATATLGDSAGVRVGQQVVGLGNAGGKGGAPSVVTGTVTGLGQQITASDQASGISEQLTGLIRTNADIQAGDSGGPLVNMAGQVIGMNTAASTSYHFRNQDAGAQPGGQGQTQAFAIPISRAHATANQIAAGRSSGTVHIGATAFLGVGLTQTGAGAGVVQVVSGSPADNAGLAAGDVIQSLGGRPAGSPSGVQSALVRYHPGDQVSLTWTDRFGQRHSATLTLVTGPPG